MFKGKYSSHLNSSDNFDSELPLTKRRATGGTMVLFKTNIEQYVTLLECPSPSILPILFTPPFLEPSIHLTIYLPTAGRDDDFLIESANLHQCIDNIKIRYPHASFFVRGDCNANPKEPVRKHLISKMCEEWNLLRLPINHKTYHHFVGNGTSDSELDVILHQQKAPEKLIKIFCKLLYPELTSHHDAIFSVFTIPSASTSHHDESENVFVAPKVPNTRIKIHWSDEGIARYQSFLGSSLSRLRDTWLDPDSKNCMSVLLQSTNAILKMCAQSCNKFTRISEPHRPKSSSKPKYLVQSEKSLRKSHRILRNTPQQSTIYHHLKSRHQLKRRQHSRLLRYARLQESYVRDRKLDSLCSKKPVSAFSSIRSVRNLKNKRINKLKVDDTTFTGCNVPDGMFSSIQKLKCEPVSLESNNNFPDFSEEYSHILDICRAGLHVPAISYHKSCEILTSMKKQVSDYYSITSLHYLNAGEEGLQHFHLMMNAFIENINNSDITELNTIYACVLYKGHQKDPENAKSYRTISTCPILAKALDLYLRELSLEDWRAQQADTQYSGENSSHELACLLLTETILNSIHISKRPVYALFLDARAAFDRVFKEVLVRNLFLAGINDQKLTYFDNRLGHRQTYCEFDHKMMGPILDTRGLEQGGVSSSELHKLYNNEQAEVAQSSRLGVPITYSKNNVMPSYLQLASSPTISCISLADDALLLANSLIDLKNLLYLTEQYCKKYDVALVPEKIQLIVFHRSSDHNIDISKSSSSLSINGRTIPFSEEVNHLGVLRSELPTNKCSIGDRISAHRKQLFSLLPTGVALHHGGNPAASLRVDRIYCLPVLISGLASLHLSKADVTMLNKYYKINISRLMKLVDRTPDCAVYFLAGTLPCEAHLHLRQLSLFSMLCRLQDNVLNDMARRFFISDLKASSSWFSQIKILSNKYGLPHPLELLNAPSLQKDFKKLCGVKVSQYWHEYFSSQTANLPSLRFLKPDFLSLSCPHPIWSSLPGSNPYEVRAARIQALLLTGRYRTEKLARHWSGNPNGFCIQASCINSEIIESREHFLLHCPALQEKRRRLFHLSSMLLSEMPLLTPILHEYFYIENTELQLQFLLDCSTLPLVITAHQTFGTMVHQALFKFTRTWCWSLHLARQRLLRR